MAPPSNHTDLPLIGHADEPEVGAQPGWRGALGVVRPTDTATPHWQERLRPRLEGLTDEEYFWEPVRGCWSVHRRGESAAPISWGSGEFTWDYGTDTEPTPLTTIAWRLGHLIESFASANGVYFGGPRVDAETYDYPGTAERIRIGRRWRALRPRAECGRPDGRTHREPRDVGSHHRTGHTQ